MDWPHLPEDVAPFASLGVALAVGLLIGLEREHNSPRKEEGSGSFLGGARTFPLFALAGGVSFLAGGLALAALALTGCMVFVGAAYISDVKQGRDRGLTTELALIVTFLLGALACARGLELPDTQRLVLVAGAGVVTTTLLAVKVTLHGFVGRLSIEDIHATVKLLVVAVIVLPLLPDETYGPLDVLNPFHIGLMVVLIAGVGFAGYVAIRALGPSRGLIVTGLVGGLVSSTAVTLSMSARAKETPAVAAPAALAVVLASTLMLPRVFIVVGALQRELLAPLAVPLGLMTAAGLAAGGVLYWRARSAETKEHDGVRFVNPFALMTALKFGALFTAVLLASKAASVYLGAAGTYAAGALAGVTDVDAIALSMARLAGQDLSVRVAATTIVIAAMSNTTAKAVLALALGGWSFGRRVLFALAAVLAAAGAGLAILWM